MIKETEQMVVVKSKTHSTRLNISRGDFQLLRGELFIRQDPYATE